MDLGRERDLCNDSTEYRHIAQAELRYSKTTHGKSLFIINYYCQKYTKV